MSNKACYIRLLNGVSKAMFRNVFLNMLTMELEFDAVYEIKVFGCNHSLMNNDDETVGACYIECVNRHSFQSMVSMLNDVFHDQEFNIISSLDYHDDGEFSDGFLLWQI